MMLMEIEAPRVRLGEVVEAARGSVPPDRIPEDADYVLLEHIRAGTGQLSSATTGESEIKSAKFAFVGGDVLYGKLRPQLRKVCVVETPGYCSMDLVPLRPVREGSAYFIAAALRGDRFFAQVERLISGANLPRINVRDLLELEIPWPTESELVRLNELARLATQLRGEATEVLERVDALERSIDLASHAVARKRLSIS